MQEELNKAAKLWNLHIIRPSTNSESPPRRPDMLYFLAEIINTEDYKTVVTTDDVDGTRRGDVWLAECSVTLFARIYLLGWDNYEREWSDDANQCKWRQSSLYRVIGEDKRSCRWSVRITLSSDGINLETQSSLPFAVICGTFSFIILLTNVEIGFRWYCWCSFKQSIITSSRASESDHTPTQNLLPGNQTRYIF